EPLQLLFDVPSPLGRKFFKGTPALLGRHAIPSLDGCVFALLFFLALSRAGFRPGIATVSSHAALREDSRHRHKCKQASDGDQSAHNDHIDFGVDVFLPEGEVTFSSCSIIISSTARSTCSGSTRACGSAGGIATCGVRSNRPAAIIRHAAATGTAGLLLRTP